MNTGPRAETPASEKDHALDTSTATGQEVIPSARHWLDISRAEVHLAVLEKANQETRNKAAEISMIFSIESLGTKNVANTPPLIGVQTAGMT